jgi:hypothetical protein
VHFYRRFFDSFYFLLMAVLISWFPKKIFNFLDGLRLLSEKTDFYEKNPAVCRTMLSGTYFFFLSTLKFRLFGLVIFWWEDHSGLLNFILIVWFGVLRLFLVFSKFQNKICRNFRAFCSFRCDFGQFWCFWAQIMLKLNFEFIFEPKIQIFYLKKF